LKRGGVAAPGVVIGDDGSPAADSLQLAAACGRGWTVGMERRGLIECQL
jgi:hypothetical protein